MSRLFEHYVRASNADENTRQEFTELVRSMPDLPRDPFQAAVEVKKHLYGKAGFIYNAGTFLVGDVFRTKSVNCLSGPLLVGALLDERGINPRFQVLINPQDEMPELERKYLERKRSGSIELALEPTDFVPMYRFAPIEHTVLDIDGNLFDTTVPDKHTVYLGETAHKGLDFRQMMGFVFHDRAILAMEDEERDEARNLLKQGRRHYANHDSALALLADLAFEQFDDVEHEELVREFNKVGQTNSRTLLDKFLISRRTNERSDLSSLEEALKSYPTYASAMGFLAQELCDSEPENARKLFGITSHMFADSTELNLGDFYVQHAGCLTKHWDQGTIADFMEHLGMDSDAGKGLWGVFHYHLVLYSLTGTQQHLGEAEEAIVSPLDRLLLFDAIKGTDDESFIDFHQLSKQHGDSKIFRRLTESYLKN
jgi:hypothetical protein